MLRTRRNVAILAGTVALLTFVAGGRAVAATVNVGVADNVFQPAQVTIAAGDTVVWTVTGQRPHTVTADDGSFDSGNLTTGQTFSRVLQTPGTVRYHCKLHGAPGGIGMSGVIVVQAAQATTTTTAATTTTTSAPAAPTTAAPTTAAPTTAAPTTAAPTTAAPPPTVAGTVTQRQAEPLPRTGLPAGVLAAAGAALLAGGAVVVRRTRRTG